ncbi:hypothetical protein AOQ89_00180 [bacterium endosymbiont of Pedicinus badii]|nr:lipoyl(octanoyl) transferase LipB [bacterium endosymbiont of Pedicinus badii]OQM34305.1 hypothetical protein AOQ89_00180 [bacterium endosymbiont of Pedicinus badii]
MPKKSFLVIKNLGIRCYKEVFYSMKKFNERRKKYTNDEIWILQHFPIYTTGISDKKKYPFFVFKSNRGGKITFHGPGQQIIYFMIDLKRNRISPKVLMRKICKIVISTLFFFNIKSYFNKKIPGIYVKKKKFVQ